MLRSTIVDGVASNRLQLDTELDTFKSDMEARITNNLNAAMKVVNDKSSEIIAAIDAGR